MAAHREDGYRDDSCGMASTGTMFGHELVVHLFTATQGPRAADGYAALRAIWADCRERLGMGHPVPGQDLPTTLASTMPPPWSTPEGVLAAQEKPDAHTEEVRQAVLRRDHDLWCLSVMVAPPPAAEPPLTWADLDIELRSMRGVRDDALLGTAWIYQGRWGVPGRVPRVSVPASADTARRCVPSLPPALRTGSWLMRGTTTGQGFGVWETGRTDDTRRDRALLVLAAADDDEALSCWSWSRPDAAMPTLVTYLAATAKIRYQLRSWGDGVATHQLLERAERAARHVRAHLPLPDPTAVDEVRTVAVDLAALTASLATRRQSIRLAARNARSALRADGTTPGEHDVFGEDLALASHVDDQLDADLIFLDAATRQVSATLEVAMQAGRSPGDAPPHQRVGSPLPSSAADSALPWPRDLALSDDDRATLRAELAAAFSPGQARHLVEELGIPRARHPRVGDGDGSPLSWWTEMFHEFDRGPVPEPYRRLLAAALARYPYNARLYLLGARHGLGLTTDHGDVEPRATGE